VLIKNGTCLWDLALSSIHACALVSERYGGAKYSLVTTDGCNVSTRISALTRSNEGYRLRFIGKGAGGDTGTNYTFVKNSRKTFGWNSSECVVLSQQLTTTEGKNWWIQGEIQDKLWSVGGSNFDSSHTAR
jgi:hypothetical protein